MAVAPNPNRLDVPRAITDHVEEFRRRLIFCIAFYFLAAVGLYCFVDSILTWLAKPIGQFIFTAPTEALFVRLKIAFGGALIISLPVLLFHAWRYIEIALKNTERQILLRYLPASCSLFVAGVTLAIFGVAPIAVRYLLGFGHPLLRPMISIDAYLSFLIWVSIGFGTLFQLPLAVLVLTQARIVSVNQLSRSRKHVIVGLLIAAAILTPGPDVVSQLILTAPTYILFEISLLAAKRLFPAKEGSVS